MNNISNAVIKRLPRYYRYLGDLLDSGIERISSNELSTKMNVTASQIRQDLNNFGGFGQQGYGYNVEYLHNEIGKILGLDKSHNVIVIGAGNLGKAIIRYPKFSKLGFKTVGIFDANPDIIGKQIGDLQISDIKDLADFVKNNDVEIAALTLPKAQANIVAKQLVDLGVKAFWNFAHCDLMVEDDVVVENVHLSDSLMQLSYNITQN